MSVIGKNLILTSPEGDEWSIGVHCIIKHRANCYGNTDEAFKSTVDLFESDDFEIEDWAVNNMDWADVESVAVQVKEAKMDMETVWSQGEFRVE